MINYTTSNIALAVIGILGLLTTFAVMSRGFRANDKYEQYLGRHSVCEACTDEPCTCE